MSEAVPQERAVVTQGMVNLDLPHPRQLKETVSGTTTGGVAVQTGLPGLIPLEGKALLFIHPDQKVGQGMRGANLRDELKENGLIQYAFKPSEVEEAKEIVLANKEVISHHGFGSIVLWGGFSFREELTTLFRRDGENEVKVYHYPMRGFWGETAPALLHDRRAVERIIRRIYT